jgi:hypothetical protein
MFQRMKAKSDEGIDMKPIKRIGKAVREIVQTSTELQAGYLALSILALIIILALI